MLYLFLLLVVCFLRVGGGIPAALYNKLYQIISSAKLPTAQKTSPLMHYLTLCWFNMGVLLFLARKGLSLECWICNGIELDCTGTLKKCSSIFDSCAIVQSYNIRGQQYVLKTCKQSTTCYEGFTAIKFAEGETVFTKVSCCKGNGCNKAAPPLPDVNMTANGRKCRGCFAINRQRCFAQAVAHCEGDQQYCSDVSGFAEVPSPIFAGNSSLPHSHLLSPRPHSSPEISFGTEHIYQGVCEALSYGAILVKYIGASGVHEAISVACAFPKSLPSSLPKFSKKKPLPLPQIVCLSFTELNNQNLAMLSKSRSQTQ
ncbi:uncharacterized protein LOC114603455 isoform X1 [Podarcis muralis]